jgi:hypothetical protein
MPGGRRHHPVRGAIAAERAREGLTVRPTARLDRLAR